AARQMAHDKGGEAMDEFRFAERATERRGNNNIAETTFSPVQREPHPVPATIVMSAGTGGTSATLGRFLRYQGHDTRLVVVDPEHSVFYDSYMQKDQTLIADYSSRIEGIGRPKVEKSFQPDVIDDMMKVPDAASVATILWLEKQIGRRAGPSTGTNLWGALHTAREMIEKGEAGSIVTLMCDSGDRYLETYYDPDWVSEKIGDVQPYLDKLESWL
ncbi:MAG: pyridoxal-phosphate dependent enzyme, partial [Rhodobacteraceae bacterium]|nr:pyridoxal-phosphate dependent enzyme [Paracoccaceae bacterium]